MGSSRRARARGSRRFRAARSSSGGGRTTEAWADAAHNNGVVRYGVGLRIDVEIVARDKEQRDFGVQPVRWRVQQTFGIMSRYRRLHRDYEEVPDRSRSMIHWAMVNSMTTRLTVTPEQNRAIPPRKPPRASLKRYRTPLRGRHRL
ncbi:transposase [Streptomyces sp. NPDC096339]|uniref:transposase n=1 Tax=Streptomyces sp. NPDC096339 TaxID=3366086 RepID=UPI00381BB6E7